MAYGRTARNLEHRDQVMDVENVWGELFRILIFVLDVRTEPRRRVAQFPCTLKERFLREHIA